MSRQLNENINLVIKNLCGNFFCRLVQNDTQNVNFRIEFPCHLIRLIVGISVNFKARLVVAFEKVHGKKSNYMKSDVGRNVTDANFFMANVILYVVLVRRDVLENLEKFIKTFNPTEKLLATDVEIMQVENQILIIIVASLPYLTKVCRIFKCAKVTGSV